MNKIEVKMGSKAVVVVRDTSQEVMVKKHLEVELEEALDLAGMGKYQVFHCALMLATLASAIIEIIGNAFILPAAACDLELPESLRGIITSVPNIGVILTAPLWGRAADTLGRKPALLTSSAAAGVIGLTASLMPGLRSYALCKLAGSLFLACPSSVGFAYAGELVPRRRRDIALLTVNGFLTISAVFSPVFAWAVLSSDWRYNLSSLTLRPWRLLTAVYAMPLILSALWMTRAKESPKFLMSKGRSDKALDVLRHIFKTNSGLPSEDYCVTSLRLSAEESSPDMMEEDSQVELAPKARRESALALLKPPHLKWLAITGFLMFGLFSLLNGLFMFATDTINKAMRGSSDEVGTVCILMNQADNQTTTGACQDDISHDTFLIMVVTTLVYGLAVMAVSLCPVSKRALLVGMYSTTAVACLLSGLLTNRMVAGAAMSALQITALGVGPLTAYAVNLFPTSLRGTAVGAVLMCGRLGSVVGANTAGYFLAVACTTTFYGFTALLFLCAGLSFLLPIEETQKPETSSPTTKYIQTDSR
ncbi:synaptic vesicle glycoprotein 2A-like [Pectinophora gossypiella]|uniref:synaptic vesicle glycoprotein 2A-like n=1 Tax=Pectinophora gossypiella TaxID=13191 RepID=UPI00214E19AC|nr:synaptic vesicle glycoprotein 2A-like [Pectinophora gossypiella]